MIIQLLVIAILIMALATWFFIKKKKILGFTFLAIAFMVLMLFFFVRYLYPDSVPF